MKGTLLSAEVTCLEFLSEFGVWSVNIEKLPGEKMNHLSPCIDFSPFFKKYTLRGSRSQSPIVRFIISQPYGVFACMCQSRATQPRCRSKYLPGRLP